MKKILLVLLAFASAAPLFAQKSVTVNNTTNRLQTQNPWITFPPTALRLDDTDASHQLTITNGSNQAAARTLTILTTGDTTLTFPTSGTLLTSGSPGLGDVVGPASATDNAIVRFDLTTGKLVQGSAITISDAAANNVSITAAATTNLTLSGGSSGAGAVFGQGASGVITFSLNGASQNAELQSSSGNVQLRVGDSTDGLFMGAQGQFHARRQTANPTIRTVTVSDNASHQGYLAFDRARGTFASAQNPGTSAASAVQSGDIFGGIVGVGHDGDASSMQHGPQIDFVADGLWSASNRASSISFKSVAAASTSQVLAMTLRGSTGTFGSQVPTWTLGTLNVFASSNQALRIRGNGEISVESIQDNGTFGALRLEGSNVQINPVLGGNFIIGKAATAATASVLFNTEATTGGAGSLTTAGGIYATKKIYAAGGILGTPTNDAAVAGNVGELLSAQLAAASTTSLVTATGKTITSISLTAGDWEVSGTVHFIPANTTVVASLVASVSATDNTQASVDSVGGYASIGAVYTSGGATMSATPIPTRISLASTTTYYLVATGTFSVSTCTAFGSIRARRLR